MTFIWPDSHHQADGSCENSVGDDGFSGGDASAGWASAAPERPITNVKMIRSFTRIPTAYPRASS
jgi:hypothetical protein